MPYLDNQLIIDRCPHCRVALPYMPSFSNSETTNHIGEDKRWWRTYGCPQCGGLVLASAYHDGEEIIAIYPEIKSVNPIIPNPAKEYLKQAIDSLHAPSASIMVAASSIDAMLKEKGYSKGSLYARINEASKDHLITEGMATWAHQVRLEANEQRHADPDFKLPDGGDAQRVIDFTLALAEFLFVLPSRVAKGITSSTPGQAAEA